MIRGIFRWGFLALALVGALWGGSDRPKGNFGIHIQTSGQGLSKMQAATVQLVEPEEVIQVSAQPEVSHKDLESIESLKTEEGEGAVLTFSRRGKMLLSALTSRAQGQIMVVYMNGRIVYSPVIDTTIADGRLVIPKNIAPVDIEMIKTVLKDNR